MLLRNRTTCHQRRSYDVPRFDSISVTGVASAVLISRRFAVRTVVVFVTEVRSANDGHFHRGGSQCERWSFPSRRFVVQTMVIFIAEVCGSANSGRSLELVVLVLL
ncbi:hypothetical protein DEO72_LG4g1225 [Vigna unguiculata]|uniref:Uncharacterized protein n=1 Tax=Vigna unguiculata TaxID=3917 RepID=A0A4D6LP37_VIGUN|nr:hypothetical protein DEO72_LG4g1225 [Vigna unguiculata]